MSNTNNNNPYYIARIRSFYGPREEMEIVKDDRGFDPEPFAAVEDAQEWIDEAEDGVYELSNGEASRPEYIVVGQETVDWLDMDDAGKYDWDGYDGAEGDEDAEHAYMRDQDIEYVRAHAADPQD